MAKFRKKPIVVEAECWHPDVEIEGVIPATELDAYKVEKICELVGFDALFQLGSLGWIETLEGGLVVQDGDWVITGVQGERYPCKPDIFEQTYEPVEKRDG